MPSLGWKLLLGRAKFRYAIEAIDTEIPTGRARRQMVGILAELEKVVYARADKGEKSGGCRSRVKMGRRRLLSAQQLAHARKLMGQGEVADNVAQSLNVSRRTLYRALAVTVP